MSALPSDIALALRSAAVATWSDPSILARFPTARDGASAPREGFCDNIADSAALAAAGALLEAQARRRWGATVDGLQWLDPTAGLPIAQLIDTEQAASTFTLVSRLALNLGTERSTLELYG